MTELYDYLEDIMPIKRVLIALAVGMISLFIVLISGLTSDFVRLETIAARAFSAFSHTCLISFVLMMIGEEYAIFKADKELEHLIDDAPIEETGEDFDREEYLHEEDETPQEANESTFEINVDDNFQPMNFSNPN